MSRCCARKTVSADLLSAQRAVIGSLNVCNLQSQNPPTTSNFACSPIVGPVTVILSSYEVCETFDAVTATTLQFPNAFPGTPGWELGGTDHMLFQGLNGGVSPVGSYAKWVNVLVPKEATYVLHLSYFADAVTGAEWQVNVDDVAAGPVFDTSAGTGAVILVVNLGVLSVGPHDISLVLTTESGGASSQGTFYETVRLVEFA